MTALELLWASLFLATGIFITFYGFQVASRIPGAYWELGNLPKAVPMAILPLSGALVTLAALFVLVEDLRAGYRPGPESHGGPTESG